MIYRKYLKRPLDILLSATALVVLSPVIGVTAILVRQKLGSPVIFKQKRPGKDEKIFTMYKFRSMTDEKDEEGNLLPDSVRLTKFGKTLRATSLDELPELFNILKGEMSVVGPRPLLIRYLPYYKESERRRHDVRPGITGLAQISGRNTTPWEKRFMTDLEYINNLSIRLDIKIILMTFFKVIKKDDILVGKEHILKDLDVEREKKYGC